MQNVPINSDAYSLFAGILIPFVFVTEYTASHYMFSAYVRRMRGAEGEGELKGLVGSFASNTV